jgi:hypothetical protein
LEEIELNYSPRDVFVDYHDRTQRWAFILAHRRAGKTVACINDLIVRALLENKPQAQYAYIAPYYRQAKTVAWTYLKYFAEPVLMNSNESELYVELINGAKIRLFGADNPDALRGLYLDGIILDEYADMKPSVWGAIVRPLLADRKGWATFIGTPKGHNNFYEMYKLAKSDNDWYCTVLRADQTNILDKEELIDAQKSMSPDQYEQEFLCSFEASIVGAYYGQQLRQLSDLDRITKVEYDPKYKVMTFWDLGYSDDTTIIFAQIIYGEIRIIDYHSSNGKSIPFYTGLIEQKEYVYDTHWLPHDARAKTLASGGKSIIEQMAAKIPLKQMKIVTSLSLQDGIQATRMALLKCWFDAEKTEELIECLKQYQREYDEDKKVFRDKPRHDWASHGADAMRMLAIAWSEEVKTVDKDKAIKGLAVGSANTMTINDMWKEVKPQRPTRY